MPSRSVCFHQYPWFLAATGLLILFSLGSTSAQPHRIRFKRIGEAEGLSQAHVTHIVQDKEGFMWFGTKDGLNKYDGYKMTVYRHRADDSTSLLHNEIRYIFEDREKNLWVATRNGLQYRPPTSDGFVRVSLDQPGSANQALTKVKIIYQDKKGTLWLGAQSRGLARYDSASRSFTWYPFDTNDGVGDLDISALLEDRGGNLWVGTQKGLYLFDRHKHSFTNFSHLTGRPAGLGSDPILTLAQDKGGTLWVGTRDNGLYSYNEVTATLLQYQHRPGAPRNLGGNTIFSILVDRNNTVWIGTENFGLNFFDRKTNAFFHYLHEVNDPSSLSNNSVSSLYQDREGNIWLGVHRGGINFFDPTPPVFLTYQEEPFANALSSNIVSTFYEDKAGNIWVGTDGGGLNLFDRRKGTFTVYKNNPQDPASLSSNVILSILEDSRGNFWLGTWNGGINLFNRRTHQASHFKHDPKDSTSLSGNHIWGLLEDQAKNLWVNTFDKGLCRLDGQGRFTRLIRLPKGLNYNYVVSMYQTRDGNFWFGTYEGLDLYQPATGRFIHYKHQEKNKTSLSNDAINVVYQDKKGNLWVGTGKGLNLFHPATQTFTAFSEQDGLIGEEVRSILEDRKGHLWLGTNKGLSRFDPSTKTFKNFQNTNGLPSNEYSREACLLTRSGEMYFGGIYGFTVFHPDSLKTNTRVPTVYLTDLQIFNQSVPVGGPDSLLRQPLRNTRQLTLSYKHSVFSFEFVALTYTLPDKTQYAYKLEGFDKHWNYVGAQRKATYTNLDPGDYTLRVKAANSDGLWGPERQLSIFIRPPWLKTIWAKVLFLGLFFGVLALIRRLMLMREKLKADIRIGEMKVENIRQLEQLKTSFFTNVSHEFRTPLTLIVSPLEKLLTKELPPPELLHQQFVRMNRNANRLLRLINQLLDLSKIESGTLRPQIGLNDLTRHLESIVRSFEEMAEARQAQLIMSIDPALGKAWYDPDILEKILSNLLSNALKFVSAGGQVSVEAKLEEEGLQLWVTDSGTGISPKELPRIFDRFYQGESPKPTGTGVGLAFTKELVDLLKGKIRVASTPGVGSRFEITLPVRATDFPAEWLFAPTGESELFPRETGVVLPVNRSSENAPILLIAEDDPDLRRYLVKCFADSFTVIEASHGEQAWRLALRHSPDVMITDWMMPEMEGLELCKRLKNDERTSHIPLVMLTAKSSQASQFEGLAFGADDYIGKPFSAALLERRVQNLIDNRRRLREAFSQEVWLRPSDVKLTSLDEVFLQKATALVEAHIDDPHFDANHLEKNLNMSQMQLYRKLKNLTALSARDFIRYVRLQRAAQLLKNSQLTVSEIAYQVGFNDPGYFTRCFKKQFNQSPLSYAKEIGKEKDVPS